MSTVFLSYSSADRELAVRVRDLLIAHGYPSVFRDKDPEAGIPGGTSWAGDLFLNLGIHDIVVFLATAASLASPWCHTELAVAVARRKHVVQISTEPVKVHPVLAATQSIGPIGDVEELVDQLVSGLTRVGLGPGVVPAWDPNDSPYPGLERLTERHAAVLFGRDREVEAVLDQLARPEPLPVLVVGPSGSGKSSLVRAGVVPRLKRQAKTVVLPVVEPGADPLGHLAVEVEKVDTKSDARRLVDEPGALALAIDRLLAGSEGGRVVLVLDQAEDLISRTSKDQVAELVRRLEAIDRDRLAVIVVLRSASLDPWIRDPALASLTPGDPAWVRPLGRSELREVIVGPARLAGIRFDPEDLVETILDDAGEGMALPLLAALLEELTRGHSRLTPAVVTADRYASVGPVARVIERRAEAAVHDIRAKVGQLEPAVVDAYLRLVEIDQDGQIVRSDLDADGLPADVRAMFDVLEEYRLVTSDTVAETTGSVVTSQKDARLKDDPPPTRKALMAVHEEVFRAWPALKRALAGRSPDLQIRTWLRRDAQTWASSGRGQVALGGGRLDLALDWSRRNARDMTDLVREYLDTAVGQRRIGRIARVAMIALAGVLAIVGVFAYQAVQARNAEEASRLATDARANFDSRLDLGLLLALEASARGDDFQAQAMPLVGLSRGPGPRAFVRLGEDVDDGAVDETGSRAVLAAADGVVLWDVPHRVRVATIPGPVTAASISADGATVAIGRRADDGGAAVDIARWPSPNTVLTCPTGAVDELRVSPTGDFVVVVTEDEDDPTGRSTVSTLATDDCRQAAFEGVDGVVSDIDVDVDRVALGIRDVGAGVWDAIDGTVDVRSYEESEITAVALGEGDQLAALTTDGSLLVWDEGEDVPRQFPVFDQSVAGANVEGSTLRYAPDRNAWVAGSLRGDVRVVQADPIFLPSAPIRSLPDAGRTEQSPIIDLAVTESGAVSVDESGRIVTWDLDGRPPLGDQVFSAGRVDLLQARPDGSILAAGPLGAWLLHGETGDIQGQWLVPPGHECVAGPEAEPVIASGSDGWAIATVSGEVLLSAGSAEDLAQVIRAPCPIEALAVLPGRMVATAHGEGTVTIASPSGTTSDVAFAERVLSLVGSGRWLFVGTADGTIHVVDTSGAPRVVASSQGHTAEVNSLEVGPDGTTLASGGDDRSIVTWTIGSDGRLADRRHLVGHTDRVNSLSISPDGRWLASSGEDLNIILWELNTGERVGDAIPVLSEPAVAFSRSGDRRLFVSDDQGGVVLWDMRPEVWARIACGLIGGRTFTLAERDRYLGGATPPARCEAEP